MPRPVFIAPPSNCLRLQYTMCTHSILILFHKYISVKHFSGTFFHVFYPWTFSLPAPWRCELGLAETNIAFNREAEHMLYSFGFGVWLLNPPSNLCIFWIYFSKYYQPHRKCAVLSRALVRNAQFFSDVSIE